MKTKYVIYVLVAMTFLLGACGPQQAATPDQNAIRQEIETSVALTVAAGDALTAAAQPAFTETVAAASTNTPFPTLTPFATITPFVITPSGGGGGGGGSGSGGGGTYYGGELCGDNDPKYMGVIIDQKPHDDSPETIRKTGEIEKLDVVWTIKNIGTKTWLPTWNWIVDSEVVNSDVPANKLLSLSPFAFPFAGIGDTIEKDEFITLGVELTMPADFDGPKPIYFTVQMALIGDGVKFCRPWIQIEVIRPGMTP